MKRNQIYLAGLAFLAMMVFTAYRGSAERPRLRPDRAIQVQPLEQTTPPAKGKMHNRFLYPDYGRHPDYHQWGWRYGYPYYYGFPYSNDYPFPYYTPRIHRRHELRRPATPDTGHIDIHAKPGTAVSEGGNGSTR